LSAAPPGGDRLAVADVNFELKAGQGLGVIGPSAAGKSSLARLLVGVWQPLRGKVRIDGAALDQWDEEVLGRHIGYLPQDVELFAGTVAENISRFDTTADPGKVIAAAKAAGVHDVIVSLRNGYDTELRGPGLGLSAGQQQRIALARALYGDPFLVVLDEPNSNLDADGEAALTQAILSVRERGGIVAVVSHRPSALAGVDTVLIMNQGRAIVFGPKDEVLPQVTRPSTQPPPAQQPQIKAVPGPVSLAS
jgi:ABC-type protease/lipase transport system fused ATPase/permease subunit